MKKNVLVVAIASLLLVACKSSNGDKEPEKKYISLQSLVEKQVAHIDTSLYSIRKVVIIDSLHSDTTYIRREDFRSVAKDFLDIPDLSDPKIANRYKEESRYDSLIKRVVITYTPIDPEKEEVKKLEMLVSPEIAKDGNNKVTGIIVDRVRNNRNGYFAQNMLWRTDKSFLITTTTQKPGEEEVITITKVTWNEEEYQ
ncbi:MAG: hypothetical protein ABL876_11135 [Chitinophagaceae bacterium]